MDATQHSLGVIRFDGNDQQSPYIVGSANEQGIADPSIPATQDSWTLYRADGRMPLEAASAAVVLHDAGVNGFSGYVDLLSLQIIPESASFPGDYDGNNEVEQGDLDLVLLHWGTDAVVPPEGWIRNLPIGAVDQAELDAVLLNWGNTQPVAATTAAVPEPATVLLLLVMLGAAKMVAACCRS